MATREELADILSAISELYIAHSRRVHWRETINQSRADLRDRQLREINRTIDSGVTKDRERDRESTVAISYADRE